MPEQKRKATKVGRPPGPATRARRLADHLGIGLPADLPPAAQLHFAELAHEVRGTYDNITPADLLMCEKAAYGKAQAERFAAQSRAARHEGDLRKEVALSGAARQELRVMQSALECLGLTGSRRGVVSRSRATNNGTISARETESGWASILN